MIKTFYNPNMVCGELILESSSSFSPLKPKLLIDRFKERNLDHHLEIVDDFKPFEKSDFLIAHKESYVDDFFLGEGKCRTNGLPWSKELAESVKWTNSSLYNAILYSIKNPNTITLSPTSGFHHAQPERGLGFCTFSGQVIASTKIWREMGLRGAYIDLDAHFGNSIEDSRNFVKDLDESIPIGFNMNYDFDRNFKKQYQKSLDTLISAIENNYIHYVVFCHGADSHIEDDFGGYLSTEDWLWCAKEFKSKFKNVNVPITLSLFGGYRKKNYQAVLDLHIDSIIEFL